MPADIKERRLEELFEQGLLAAGYTKRGMDTYDVKRALDPSMLMDFLKATQPGVVVRLKLVERAAWERFLDRVCNELRSKGVVEVLRNGVSHESCSGIRLYYALPDEGNAEAQLRYTRNTFGVIRQLAYSQPHVQDPGILDMALYINGIPVVTIELKNEFTEQTYKDAIQQYQRDRDPNEPLLRMGRCAAHFAIDNHDVYMCAELKGAASRFMPFNKGQADGSAGNPPNPAGVAVSYMWEDILTPATLCDILEHYARRVTTRKVDRVGKTEKKVTECIFPRYHQQDAVRKLLADLKKHGIGRRYLVQHSAGSGKSNTISWLVLQLAGVRNHSWNYVFDKIVVVTDRRNLDGQLNSNIGKLSSMKKQIFHAERSGKIASAIQNEGTRIIVSTIQKFPHVLEHMQQQPNLKFAIVIDEAHSSQGGKNTGALHKVLGLPEPGSGEDDEPDVIDALVDYEELEPVDRELEERARLRAMLKNASYFAFTATPKVKTLRMFGQAVEGVDGSAQYEAFHTYSMKQAIQEGFIMDVLASYTPIASYYRIMAREGADTSQEYDANKAQAKLRAAVEGQAVPVAAKASIMIDHFLRKVARNMRGEARAMVVCSSIQRAIDYYRAIKKELKARGSSYLPVIAFSGEKEVDGEKMTEETINGFPSSEIEERVASGDYRILVVADKFQTGYDEKLMQTMYVDKRLSGVKTVQTLSRLNRAHPDKRNTFVLDFYNDPESVRKDFEMYYTTTVLSGECDADKLHDLKYELDEAGVYTQDQMHLVVELFLTKPENDLEMRAQLDTCREAYCSRLDTDEQIRFKGSGKAFCRYYDFMATILSYTNVEWERLSCFLHLLIKDLPSPQPAPDDHITEAIQLESYRVEVEETLNLALAEDEGELEAPTPTGGGGRPEPRPEPLEAIISFFNDTLGDIEWRDSDKVKTILREMTNTLAQDAMVKEVLKNSDEENAKLKIGAAISEYLISSLATSNDQTVDWGKLLQAYTDSHNGFQQGLIEQQLRLLRALLPV